MSTNWTEDFDRAACAVAALKAAVAEAESATVEGLQLKLHVAAQRHDDQLKASLQLLRDGLVSPQSPNDLAQLLAVLHDCIDQWERAIAVRAKTTDITGIKQELAKAAHRKRCELDAARARLVVAAQRPVSVAAPVPQTILDRNWLCSSCSAVVRSEDAMLMSGHRNGVVCRSCFEKGVSGAQLGGAQDPSVSVRVAKGRAAGQVIAEFATLPADALAELNQAAAEDFAAENAESPAADLEAALDLGIDWEPEA